MEDVITRRLARLSAPCRRLIEVAAREGGDLEPGALRALTGTETEQFLDHLDEAERADVLAPSPWRPHRYRFVHSVIRDIVRHRFVGQRARDHQGSATDDTEYGDKL